MQDFMTVREASEKRNLNKSAVWIRAAIKSGKIKAQKVNDRLYLIAVTEVEHIRANPITVSKDEY